MLYIISNHGEGEFSWHVGSPIPNVPVEKVTEVQADGDELEYLRSLFGTSIAMPNTGVANWYGDWARTIYLNLGKRARSV